MGCFGDREKGSSVEEQKWDYITLTDFRSSGFKTKFSYFWLWFLTGIAVASYAADTFTAINLLAFNEWSSGVDPAIELSISKWIFAGCIMFSWVLCAFEWIHAIRVIRGGNVADSYLNPLAATIQSCRIYKGGYGWRKFLLFAELTKSKKGTDYIALFVYFQFKSALHIIFAEGPRQVINALTLWAVMKADLLPDSTTVDISSIEKFWQNVEVLAEDNEEQAITLGSMLFTLVIWAAGALSLLTAGILYLLFLWHYVPSSDGSLSNYCRRKVDKRLDRIVSAKTKAAIEHEVEKRKKEEQKAIKDEERAARAQQKGGKGPANAQRNAIPRKPTLPQLGSPDNGKLDFEFKRTDTLSTMDTQSTKTAASSLAPSRSNTSSTSNTMPRLGPTSRQPTLPTVGEDLPRPGMPQRSDTGTSGWSSASYRSDAPLLNSAADMSYDMPKASMNRQNSQEQGPMYRSLTSNSNGSFAQPMRPPTAQDRNTPTPGMQMRPNAFGPQGAQGRNSPAPGAAMPMQPPTAQGRNSPAPGMVMGPGGRAPPHLAPAQGRNSPAMGMPMRPDGYGPPMRSNTGLGVNDARGPQAMGISRAATADIGAMHQMPGPMRANTDMGMGATGRRIPGPSPLTNPETDFAPYGRHSPTPGPMQIPEPAYEMQQPQRSMAPYQESMNAPAEAPRSAYPHDETDSYDPYRSVTPIPMPPDAASIHSRTNSDPISLHGAQPAEPASSLATASSSNEAAQRASGVYVAFNPIAHATPSDTSRGPSTEPPNDNAYAQPTQHPVAAAAAAALAAARNGVSPLYEQPGQQGYGQGYGHGRGSNNGSTGSAGRVSPLWDEQNNGNGHARGNSITSAHSMPVRRDVSDPLPGARGPGYGAGFGFQRSATAPMEMREAQGYGGGNGPATYGHAAQGGWQREPSALQRSVTAQPEMGTHGYVHQQQQQQQQQHGYGHGQEQTQAGWGRRETRDWRPHAYGFDYEDR